MYPVTGGKRITFTNMREYMKQNIVLKKVTNCRHNTVYLAPSFFVFSFFFVRRNDLRAFFPFYLKNDKDFFMIKLYIGVCTKHTNF